MLRFLKTSFSLTSVFGTLGLMASVYINEAEKLHEPEKTPHAQDDPSQAKTPLPGAFAHAGYSARAPLAETSVLRSRARPGDYSYVEERDIALNPYFIRALENDEKARGYLQLIRAAAAENNLDWRVAANQIFRESYHFKDDIVLGRELSGAGAVGIAQFMPATAREKFGVGIDALTDPEKAIPLYARHMSDLLRQYDNDIALALIAYNGGEGAIDWIREELQDPDAGGVEAMVFLHKRRLEKGDANPGAWHNESRGYALAILGVESPLPSERDVDPVFVAEQNAKLNDPMFVALLDKPVNLRGLLADMAPRGQAASERPVPRPDSAAPATSKRPEPRRLAFRAE